MIPRVPPLLGSDDPDPYTILNPKGKAHCLLVCDHAGNRVPRKLGALGLCAADYGKHWAIDIGTRAIAESLAPLLDAPAIMANYSRIVIDLNRAIDHPTLCAESGEGQPIPGNLNLDEQNRNCRIEEIYNPYHRAIDRLLDESAGRNIVPVVLSIHSFTPALFGKSRPWDIGVLWAQDNRIAPRMIEFFRDKGLVVGDNEPYDARLLSGTTLHRHADVRKLPNVLVEIRNDHLCNPENCRIWTKMLGDFMNKILADDSIHTLYDGPAFHYDPEISKQYFDTINKKNR